MNGLKEVISDQSIEKLANGKIVYSFPKIKKLKTVAQGEKFRGL
jgi:hypothetical protein